MRKENIIILSVLLIIIVGVVIANFENAFGGVATLSISQADLQSSSQYFSGKAWLLTFVANELGQSYTGTFTPEQVDAYTDGVERPLKTFSVNVNYGDEKCSYNIQGDNENIYDVFKLHWLQTPWDWCDENEAASRGMSNVLGIGKPSTTLDCYAVGYNTYSQVKDIQNPTINTQYTVAINVQGGESATATFNTATGSRSGPIGNLGYIVGLGSLVSGKECTNQNPYKAAYVNSNWRTVSSVNYQRYLSTYDDIYTLFEGGVTNEKIINWVNTVNSQASTAKISTSFGSVLNPSSYNSATIELTPNEPLTFPVSTLYIKADTIGIYTPVPDIRIVSISSECFTSASQGVISINLKNYGESGGANVYASCSTPFVATSNNQISLNKDESRTINLPISATTTEQIKSSCIVTIEGTFGKKTSNVAVCVNPVLQCTAGATYCGLENGLDVVKQCTSDGAREEIKERCNTNQYCTIVNGQGKCLSEGTGGGISIWDKIKGFFGGIIDGIKSIFTGVSDLLTITKYIIVAIATVISVFISYDLLDKFKGLNKKNKVKWVVSIVFSLLIALFLFYFILSFTFWIIIIVIAFFMIIKNFIPRIRR